MDNAPTHAVTTEIRGSHRRLTINEGVKSHHLAHLEEPTTPLLDRAEATALTQRIRSTVDGLWDMLLEAHDRRAWKALGYKTWAAYVKAELDMGRSRSYQLLDQDRVIEAVRGSTGNLSTDVDISEAAARDIKPDLPAVTDEIKARVEAGEDTKKAAADAIAAKRADKAEKQAELDRQRDEHREKMSEAVKQAQAAKRDAIEARKATALLNRIEPYQV